MTNLEKIIKDIERLNESKSMDFNEWMMWGMTQITLMTAMILDNVENMEIGRKESHETDT
jgi:hypothetical protein